MLTFWLEPTVPIWEVKKEPFLSCQSTVTPPKDAYAGGKRSDVQKGHSWKKDLQRAEEVTQGKSLSLKQPHGQSARAQIQILLEHCGFWDWNWLGIAHFSAQLHF